MRKSIILTAISFLTMLAPLPGTSYGTTAERYINPNDIWVYDGYYAYFEGGLARLESSDLEELRTAFTHGTGAVGGAERIDADKPLNGQIDAHSIFVLDDTALYFDDAALSSGGLYGFCGVDIISGSLSATTVSAAGGLFIAPGVSLTVYEEINVGGTVECFGGSIIAGGVNAGSVWLDSAEAPLDVTVIGNVFTGFYTQCGGNVRIGGGLYCSPPGTQISGALMTVNNEYSAYGAARLTVYGDVVSLDTHRGVEVGGGYGGYDEAARCVFEKERSARKCEWHGAYDTPVSAAEVTLVVGGELRSLGSTALYEGLGK